MVDTMVSTTPRTTENVLLQGPTTSHTMITTTTTITMTITTITTMIIMTMTITMSITTSPSPSTKGLDHTVIREAIRQSDAAIALRVTARNLHTRRKANHLTTAIAVAATVVPMSMMITTELHSEQSTSKQTT